MHIKILGSGAGGGFPQWNCRCANCRGIRRGTLKSHSRTQSQLAVSGDGEHWFLLNASPDLRAQIEAAPALWPREGSPTTQARHSPISGAILTNADLDHVLGLLLMRESQPLHIYSTSSVKRVLNEDNTFFRMLNQFEGQTRWSDIQVNQPFLPTAQDGSASGLRITPLPVTGRYPIYVTPARAAALHPLEAVLGLRVEDVRSGKSFAYLPGLPELTTEWVEMLKGCELAFIDGTFWSEDELRELTGGGRSSTQMGHQPVQASLPKLAALKGTRVIYVHINNTNPILDEQSAAFRKVVEAGIQVGKDGMEFTL